MSIIYDFKKLHYKLQFSLNMIRYMDGGKGYRACHIILVHVGFKTRCALAE